MKVIKVVGMIIFLVGCVALGIYNWRTNVNFFTAPLTTIVSIVVAVVISYFFVQRKTDDRRKREKVDKLLYKIQEMILDEKFIEVKEQDLIIQRSIANKITYLKNNVIDKNIKTQVERIEEIFGEYREFYSNHYKDVTYMEKSKKELANYVTRIDDVCDEIHMKLM